MSDPATDPFDADGVDEELAAAPGIGAELEVDGRARAGDAADLELSDDPDGSTGSDDEGAGEASDTRADGTAGSDEADDGTVDAEPGGDARDDARHGDGKPDYLGDLQRVTAEFANFRKQTEKRNQELQARATLRLAEALLPVLDACDAAARQGIDGVEPIHTQLLTVLGQEGLEVIAEVDEPFDPNRHDAVMTEPADDGGDQTVVAEVLRTGYAWKGRVFRPAMVKVRG